MVYLELVSNDESRVVYDYMPEMENAPKGRIAVSKADGSRTVIERSQKDDFSIYLNHAFRRIEQMARSGDFKQKTYAAWF